MIMYVVKHTDRCVFMPGGGNPVVRAKKKWPREFNPSVRLFSKRGHAELAVHYLADPSQYAILPVRVELMEPSDASS